MSLRVILATLMFAFAGCGTDVLDHGARGDTDQDGLDDDVEEQLGTDPDDPDSDDDGLLDGAEVENDLDPLDPNSN